MVVVCVGVRIFVSCCVCSYKLFKACVFFRKAIIGCKWFNISLALLSMLNMCQCLFIISFIFGSTGLYVNENGIVSLRLGLQCFKSNGLSRWSTLSIFFLQSIHCSSLQKSFLLGLMFPLFLEG